jgi:hypothetical protein
MFKRFSVCRGEVEVKVKVEAEAEVKLPRIVSRVLIKVLKYNRNNLNLHERVNLVEFVSSVRAVWDKFFILKISSSCLSNNQR